MMRVCEFSDANAFAQRTSEFLLAREAECCVELGSISQLTRGGPRSVRGDTLESPRLWIVEDDRAQVDAVLMQTMKDRMIVSRGSSESMRLLARKLVEIGWREKSINGRVPGVREFVDEYTKLTHRSAICAIGLRTFQLMRVIRPRPAGGSMRPCTADDRELLERWPMAFGEEVGDPFTLEHAQQGAIRLIEDKRAWFWVDQKQQPLAMAAHAGPTPNGIRVNLVYTPPENRGKGYCSNLVAALSQHHLDAGRKFCFLHTDIANPTSNSIYQKLGYKPVCDGERWDFA